MRWSTVTGVDNKLGYSFALRMFPQNDKILWEWIGWYAKYPNRYKFASRSVFNRQYIPVFGSISLLFATEFEFLP